jgi:hypothetical protein
MQNKCAEIKIRAERRAGELLKDMQEKGEVETPGGDRKSLLRDELMINGDEPKQLSEVGITPVQSHRWKALADMPEEAKPRAH